MKLVFTFVIHEIVQLYGKIVSKIPWIPGKLSFWIHGFGAFKNLGKSNRPNAMQHVKRAWAVCRRPLFKKLEDKEVF